MSMLNDIQFVCANNIFLSKPVVVIFVPGVIVQTFQCGNEAPLHVNAMLLVHRLNPKDCCSLSFW